MIALGHARLWVPARRERRTVHVHTAPCALPSAAGLHTRSRVCVSIPASNFANIVSTISVGT